MDHLPRTGFGLGVSGFQTPTADDCLAKIHTHRTQTRVHTWSFRFMCCLSPKQSLSIAPMWHLLALRTDPRPSISAGGSVFLGVGKGWEGADAASALAVFKTMFPGTRVSINQTPGQEKHCSGNNNWMDVPQRTLFRIKIAKRYFRKQ